MPFLRNSPSVATARPNRCLLLIARVSLGIVFLGSGILKLFSPNAVQALLSHLIPIGSIPGRIAVTPLWVVEASLGLFFLSSKCPILPALAASLFLLGSTVLGVMLLSDPVPFGCFGGLLESKADEWFLLRNLGLFGLAIVVLCALTRERVKG